MSTLEGGKFGEYHPLNPLEYTDGHRLLLQLLMKQPVMEDRELQKLFKKLTEALQDREEEFPSATLDEALRVINAAISWLSLEIRMAIDETTCEKYRVLISLATDRANSFGSLIGKTYSDGEVELIKMIIHHIMSGGDENDDDVPADGTDASSLVSLDAIHRFNDQLPRNQKLDQIALTAFLDRATDDHWLAQTEVDAFRHVSLGIRAIGMFLFE
tara:strand:+ start:1394 stop:2038 length:645 start_codon:yes stop_codon:yes gene_type:complete